MPKLTSKLQNTERVIGIDNGLTGGAVVLEGRRILDKLVTPVMAKEKGNEIDVWILSQWLEQYVNDNTGFVIEKPGGAQSYKAAVSMANTIGQITALMRIKQYRFLLITPNSWQKIMLPNCKKGQTKKFALSAVKNLWPKEIWTATERSNVPHAGIVDAALIAEFARRTNLF